MTIGAEAATDVLAALGSYGQALTLRKVNEGTYDPTTGGTTGASTSDTACTGMMQAYKNRDIDGERIKANDRRCIIAASGLAVAPETGDRIVTAAAAVYTVIAFQTVELNGSPIYYAGQVRNAG